MTIIDYLQIPYRHQGRDTKGADCFGLIRIFYEQELGLLLPDFTEDYTQEWWKEKNYFIDLYRQWNFAQTSERKRGNVILFKNTNSTPGHVGVILNDESFLHMSREGCETHSYTYGVWARQIHSVYRHVGE
ncbi:C40 family peptidase [Geobacter sp. SVR]|uniref:C40 family peptidase n=1 Tax=Geobacter sp. SVR TaxID=2495594 RepID=UPI00143F0083|nr:NlpC/P60 family protein [Geobacter sp. SVR]BCS54044.1 hypothetical protein GSVR_23520 [Geobacter sp. SVR]GCF86175.1 tail assembly protein [Geobacter sp. SVR]